MELLSALAEVYEEHPQTVNTVNNMIVNYNEYLANLEMQKSPNKDLIHCLQSS